jgi:hypothetical protein
MPKADLRVLHSSAGPFHKAECPVFGDVSPEIKDFTKSVLKQFDARLFR